MAVQIHADMLSSTPAHKCVVRGRADWRARDCRQSCAKVLPQTKPRSPDRNRDQPHLRGAAGTALSLFCHLLSMCCPCAVLKLRPCCSAVGVCACVCVRVCVGVCAHALAALAACIRGHLCMRFEWQSCVTAHRVCSSACACVPTLCYTRLQRNLRRGPNSWFKILWPLDFMHGGSQG